MEYKGYIIEVTPGTTTFVIHHTGKGSLPKMLSSGWTTVGAAKKQIDSYLSFKASK